MSCSSGPPPGAGRKHDARKVHEAEILGPESAGTGRDGHRGQQYDGFYAGTGPEGAWHGPNAIFTNVFTSYGPGQTACMAPAISLFLFLICLFRYGFLAGLGFVFFLGIGSAMGSWRNMRLLMYGRQYNPWAWRVGNWAVSFFLTVWLAGGLDG